MMREINQSVNRASSPLYVSSMHLESNMKNAQKISVKILRIFQKKVYMLYGVDLILHVAKHGITIV